MNRDNSSTDPQGTSPSPTLAELQSSVHDWITTIGVRYFDPLTNMSILTEEVGEVARIIARLYGEQSTKPGEEITTQKLADELMDVLWVVTCIANQTGCDLTEAWHTNISKKSQRDQHRHRDNNKLR